jgi:hypothetical protein
MSTSVLTIQLLQLVRGPRRIGRERAWTEIGALQCREARKLVREAEA